MSRWLDKKIQIGRDVTVSFNVLGEAVYTGVEAIIELEDHEDVPTEMWQVLDILGKDLEGTKFETSVSPKDATVSEVDHALAFLAAVDKDVSKDADDWKSKRNLKTLAVAKAPIPALDIDKE